MKTSSSFESSFANCLLQAPCVIKTPVGEAQHDAKHYMSDIINNVSSVVIVCMPGLHTTGIKGQAKRFIPEHPALTQDNHRVLNALIPVQGWLRNSSLERKIETGYFESPPRAVFADRLKSAVAASRQSLSELTECTEKFEAFGQALPRWMALLENTKGSGIVITAETAAQLAGFGVEVTKPHVTEEEWILILACLQKTLEQSWIACNTAHQVAYMSVQRGFLVGIVNDSVQHQLLSIRKHVESDHTQKMPDGLEWIDQAMADPLNAIWLRLAKPEPTGQA
ncbi:hypothetical protein [Limnohabitans sp.]|jgi:hypothetical protein|uniref:hypothetical protein n=1 Tax=Limnohabitans sp. TaxID=1907725 RepID=UPI0037BF6BE3